MNLSKNYLNKNKIRPDLGGEPEPGIMETKIQDFKFKEIFL